ncbi:MAG TPA: endonuclease III [Fimbriimonadaceae bacterium]
MPTRKPVLQILEILEAAYGLPENTRRFEPMDELVSCILSQHTSDLNSFPAFHRLKAHYKDWQDLIDRGQPELAEVIKAAGLANQKSKNIIRCLAEIKEKNGDYTLDNLRTMEPLEARAWLMELPGIGPKTASIVLCFSLDMDILPVDTHVYRVTWRVGFIPENSGESKAHDLLLKVVPKGLAFRFHMDLIHHGRAVCKAPVPHCEQCPITQYCRWFKHGGPENRRKELRSRRKRVGA